MSDQREEGPGRPPDRSERPLSDPLRAAVSRTLEATSGSASETRQRVGELLDEVARRGQEARIEIARTGEQIARAGQGAREELARRGQEAGGELRRRMRELGFARADDLDALASRLHDLEARVAELERPADGTTGRDPGSEPEVEG